MSSTMSASVTTSTPGYTIVRNKPVAKFRYKGSHSKPVIREVVLTEVTPDLFRGYEIREGRTVRSISSTEIKSFTREKIVDGTLVRMSLAESGITIS